ncbi:type VII secretion protein EccE [Mycobacterium sp. PS03-16]|uniref:type VII secretion protein EccE n=1 Tax=Mycobacterium sp. PS03-16 TaxID=2559611 RepID=UPI0010746BEA|nr:type VII secretion protein EccE [Mycobacterium sp. PS03-16]TFV55429.1 type VII secretion protein EccE [Mycobacterium sp. PS03-16]
MTARITLALLFVIPAALAYPWDTTIDRWVLGAAIVAVVVLFAWWRGHFVTELVRRRLAIVRRNRGRGHAPHSGRYETAVLRVDAGPDDALPVPLLAGYVDRYGLRADKVRLVSRDAAGVRTTWIALTLGATDNLAALRARSARLPLRETTDIAVRRLADHLREIGWDVSAVDDAESPVPPSARETWRGLRDESGFTAAYRVRVDGRLAETFAAVAAQPATEVWTALDITGTATHPELIAGCAVRTADRPPAGAPVAGLTPQRGRHRPALQALHPFSTSRLEGDTARPGADAPAPLSWPVTGRRTAEVG